MSNELSIRQQLEKTPAANIASLPSVQERFMQLYKTFNITGGSAAYEAEKFHFAKIVKNSEKLSACTKLSLYGCFLDMGVNGLSFDPAMKHAYLVPFSASVKVNGKDVWEQRAQLQISGIGELALRVKSQQIKYADNPVLVYDCDLFSMGTKDNSLFISHDVKLPRAENAVIIACYLRITRNDDSIDYKVLTMPEIDQIKKFSKDPNSKAWTIGLPGMVQSKTIKHAFRTYPKLRTMQLTKFSALESETIDTTADEVDIYKLDDTHVTGSTPIAAALQPTAQRTPNRSTENMEDFAEQNYAEAANDVSHDDDNF